MFIISVRSLTDDLHEYDVDVAGDYPYHAMDEEHALDLFHDSIPIKVLDDFEITVRNTN